MVWPYWCAMNIHSGQVTLVITRAGCLYGKLIMHHLECSWCGLVDITHGCFVLSVSGFSFHSLPLPYIAPFPCRQSVSCLFNSYSVKSSRVKPSAVADNISSEMLTTPSWYKTLQVKCHNANYPESRSARRLVSHCSNVIIYVIVYSQNLFYYNIVCSRNGTKMSNNTVSWLEDKLLDLTETSVTHSRKNVTQLGLRGYLCNCLSVSDKH